CISVTLVAFVVVSFSFNYFRFGMRGISVIGLFPGLLLLIPGAFVGTILGWIAISQIRRSKGQVHGLQLAIFDALVYPLMAFNAVVALASVALAKMFVDFYANPALINNPHTGILTRLANWVDVNKEIVVFLAVATSVVVSVIIVRAVRRAVNSPVAAQPKSPITTGESNESTLVSIAMLLAIMSSVLGLLAAIRPGGVSWLFMVLSLFMASLAILMAMPARRFSAGGSTIVVAGLGIVIWPLVAIIMANERSESAIVYQSPEPLRLTSTTSKTRGFPTGSHIGGNDQSVLVTHDQVDPNLNYVFYYAGDFSTTSSGSQNLATMTWSDEGSVKLRNGRTFGYRREGLYPDELTVNGETFDLTSGRVLVLHNDSSLQQLRIFPPLEVAQSPERLAKYIADSERPTGSDGKSRTSMLPSPDGEWSPAMLELARQVGNSRADGASSPDELIQWGSEAGGLELGLLIAGTVTPGDQLNSRLVIRSTSDGNTDQTLLLKGCVLQLLTRDSDRTTVDTQISVVLVEAPDVPITLLPGEKIEMEARPIQFGGSIVPPGGTTYKVNIAPGFTFVKFQLDQPGRATLETGEATVFVDPFAARSTVTQMLAFTLHHTLASGMEVALHQVLKERPAQKAVASPDDKTLFVFAYNNVMQRVRTFITVDDATDELDRVDTFDYPKQTPLVVARSFFHACAIQDSEEAISNLLSLRILTELRGDHSPQYEEFKTSGIADPEWEAELRGDWPGKRERIRDLVSRWNRYALGSLDEVHEVTDESNGEFILKALFADAPDEDCPLSVIRCTKKLNEDEDSFCINCVPPWSPQSPSASAPAEEVLDATGRAHMVVVATPQRKDVTLSEQYVCRIEKQADDTQMDVYYNVPEVRYLDYKAAKLDEHLDNLKVELILTDGSKFNHPGKLVSMGSEFNPQTGTTTFRAELPNPDRLLRHGMTGIVRVSRVQKDALAIPQKATFEVLNKRYIYVIDHDHVARRREIDIQSEMDDVFVVKSGLGVNDRFVVEGVRVLLDGEHEH
ncbi:MAG TPA: hypothetical protein PLR25_09045, partial [Planctomycetaceae bacterium]|nr:hypothetical protein [Planctomycetaceae bacterium]